MAPRRSETKEEYNARMNEYMKAKYFRRRNAAIEQLGGKCIDCGATNDLEFDHVDPKNKTYNIAQIFSSHSEEKLQKEIQKCVLRCVACHAHITALQKLQSTNLLVT